MTVGAISALAGIGASLVAIIMLFVTLRDRVRSRVDQDTRERSDLQRRSFQSGADSRNDEVRQLTFERDQASRERDEAKLEARDLRVENRTLRDRRA